MDKRQDKSAPLPRPSGTWRSSLQAPGTAPLCAGFKTGRCLCPVFLMGSIGAAAYSGSTAFIAA